jgi:hypothetical protein
MGKRQFRHRPLDPTASDYPTLDAFDADRRRFLAGLGGLLGATALAACGSRAAPASADAGEQVPTKKNPPPVNNGGALPPPAQLDGGPDGSWDGDPPMPDARVDQSVYPGEAPQPDARVDQDNVAGGPMWPPARGDAGCDDSGSCPNP